MSRGTINEQYLDDIAVAINAKLGSSSTMTPSEMALKISSIPTSSSAILGHGSFSANGSYRALDDNLDGYSTVDVSIPMAILSASSNGTYTPSVGGYNQVNVSVPLSSITISVNGSYSAAQGGYNDITVDVPQPTMSTLSVSANGSYTADPNTGFDIVNVDVPEINLSSISISINGSYSAVQGTGYNQIDVNVPSAALSSKTITVNGIYNAIDDSLDGYDTVTVSVPGGAVLGSKTITENGTYNAIDDNLNGYDVVSVSVDSGYGKYDWYDDGVDVTITTDDINLNSISSTTSFYDTYYNQNINTLTVNVGTSTVINGFNINPYKKINFKKLVVGSGITRVSTFGGSEFNCMKDLDIKSTDLSTINYTIGRSASSLVNISFPTEASYSFNASRVFAECRDLETVTLPTSLTVIPSSFLATCPRLVSINLEDLSNLTTISSGAFYQCYALDVDFSQLQYLTTIDRDSFANTAVEKVKSSTLTTIGASAFQQDTDLIEVDTPSLVNLGISAFAYCTELEKVTLSPSLSVIQQQCFYGCRSLNNIDLSNITSIGSSAFYYCYKLQDINLDKVEAIESQAFAEAGLTQIVLPSTVTTLGSSCFRGTKISMADLGSCNAITSLPQDIFSSTQELSTAILPSTMITLGNYCFYNSGLKSINLPDTVVTIGVYCFSNTDLSEITLPSSVTTIGSQAFYNVGLSELILPSSVTTIGSSAFNTSTLKTLTLYDENITLQNNSFGSGIIDIYYRGSQGKTAADLETEYLAKYGSNNQLKPTATRTVHYVPYEDWHTE